MVLREMRQRKISNQFPSVDSNPYGDVNSSTIALGVAKPMGSKPFCTHCSHVGHTIDRCYRIHVFPTRSKPRSFNFTPASGNSGQYGNSISSGHSNSS